MEEEKIYLPTGEEKTLEQFYSEIKDKIKGLSEKELLTLLVFVHGAGQIQAKTSFDKKLDEAWDEGYDEGYSDAQDDN